MIGERVDQFNIERLIAQGGMAEVYEGVQESLGRRVAVKIMLPAYAQQEELVSRFQREGRAAAKLSHPNIIQIFAIGQIPDGRPYLAMEYCPLGSLEDRLVQSANQNRYLPTDETLGIVSQIARALSVAHRADIVHRDLKPGNILFREDGAAVLADLGIAAVSSATRLTNTGAILGTPHYMSPEQALGRKVDGRSDIYALGIILFQSLSGQRPFDAELTPAILHQHVYEPPPQLEALRPRLRPEIYAIVNRCLEKDPAKRYQTAAELAAALDQAHGAASVTPQPGTRSAMRGRRTWRLAVTGIVALALLFVILRPKGDGDIPLAPTTVISGETVVTQIAGTTSPGPTSTVFVPPTAPATADQQLTTDVAADTKQPVSTAGGSPGTVNDVADVTALYITNPSLIDGATSEWAAQPAYISAHQRHSAPGWDGSADLQAIWSVAWDEEALYLVAFVSDDTHVQTQSGRMVHLGDSLDLQINTDPPARSNRINPAIYQIALSPGNFANLRPEAFRFQGTPNGQYRDAPGHGIQVAARQTVDGYVLEAAVPWADLLISPLPGHLVGLALNASDNDTPGTARQEVMLSSAPFREWADPSSWGTLTLSGAVGGGGESTIADPLLESVLTTITVDSKLARKYSGLQVERGQTVEIAFRDGEWRAGSPPDWPMVGPRGDPQVPSKGTFPVPDAPLMTLIGGVGDEPPFIIGEAFSFISTVNGPLWLGANDDGFADNSGMLRVDITISE